MTCENKTPPTFALWLVLSSIDSKIDVALTFTVFTFVFEFLMWSQEKFNLNLATVLSSFKKVFQNFSADLSTPFSYVWGFI